MNYYEDYIKHYNLNDYKLIYKYYHSKRVMNNMILLAKNFSLPPKDIELAKYIGLFHDIGRFEQYRKFNRFKDSDLDHGMYASTYLKETKALSNLEIAKEDYEVVYKAIENHNRLTIEPNLTNRELLFSKMLRDSDKLDILYSMGEPKIKKDLRQDDSDISNLVRTEFYNHILVPKNPKMTINDNYIKIFSYVYDINFNITLDIIKTNNYYEKIYNRLNNKEKYQEYLEYVLKYIDERID